MNKIVAVIGVAAVATLVGCKDEDYKYAHDSANKPMVVSPATADSPAAVPVAVVEKPTCKCPPGTKHVKPCLCGAPDCACIVLPPPPPPPPPPAPEYTVYVVKNGDYLAKISKRFNVTINSIKRLNNLKNDSIRVGQKLKLPGKLDIGAEGAEPAAVPAKTMSASSAAYKGETKEYVVKNGDTLGAIAYGNGCTIRQLKALNGLKSDTLRVGQKIKIPANGKPVAKSVPAKKAPAAPAAAPATPAPAPAVEQAAPAATKTAVEQTAPAATEPAAEPAAPAAAPEPQYATYEVQDGEDMTAICIRFNVSAAVIRELNNLPDGAQLTKGQIIKLPPEAQQ